MIDGGKDKYVSLLTLIKHESHTLYELICDLCLDHTFRSQRYENTFLMPNKALVDKIKKMYEKDEDEDAIKAIRSLLLKGHLSVDSFKKDANIGTIDPNTILADPVKVKENLSVGKKKIIATKTGAHATIVLQYNGDAAPATAAGKTGGFIPVGSMIGGGAQDENAKVIKELTLKMIVNGNASTTVDNFFKGVCKALSSIKGDESKYNNAKFYLAENPILSWFFLTMPGSNHGLVKGSDLGDFDFNTIHDCQEHLDEAMEAGGYKFDKTIMSKNKALRGHLQDTKSDRSSLPDAIQKAYSDNISKWSSANIDDTLKSNVHLKILMDELRFMYEAAVAPWGDVDDAISHLGAINWNKPQKELVVCCKEVHSKLKSPEVFTSGPIKFVQSIYFLYVPLSNTVSETLGGMQGGAEFANPSTIRNVIYSGGAARKKMYSAGSKFNAHALVKGLTPRQVAELKAAL